MGNKVVLSNSGIINNNIDETNFISAKISGEKAGFSQAIFNMDSEVEGTLSRWLSINGLSVQPLLKVFASILHGSGHAIKVIMLLALSFIYSVIAVSVVILYLIFFKHLIEKLINKVKKEKRKSSYYYSWKNHHLDMNWEA